MKSKALLAALIAVTSTTIYAAREATYGFLNTGTVGVLTIDIKYYHMPYWTERRQVWAIDWGMLKPGESKMFVGYARNEGDYNVTLVLNTTAWTPLEAQQQMLLSWNYSGAVLQPQGYEIIALTLTVDPNVTVQTFQFNVVITAIET